jgi:hypothetical protein
VQQLQRRLRVSGRLDELDACRADLWARHVCGVRRDVVHQLQRWLHLPGQWVDERDGGDLCCRYLQRVGLDGVQQLYRRLRLSAGIDELDACCAAVSSGQVQSRRRCRVQQLQCWLRVSGRLDELHACRADLWTRQACGVWRDVMHRLQRWLHLPR